MGLIGILYAFIGLEPGDIGFRASDFFKASRSIGLGFGAAFGLWGYRKAASLRRTRLGFMA